MIKLAVPGCKTLVLYKALCNKNHSSLNTFYGNHFKHYSFYVSFSLEA